MSDSHLLRVSFAKHRYIPTRVASASTQEGPRCKLSQVMNCIACLEDLGSMGKGLLIYMIAQHLVAKP